MTPNTPSTCRIFEAPLFRGAVRRAIVAVRDANRRGSGSPQKHCPSGACLPAILPAETLSAHPVGGGNDRTLRGYAQRARRFRTAFMHKPSKAHTMRRGTERSPLDSFTYRKDS